ncbi:MAG: GatB/YqeY domain-containing protein [Patescibacteria group bacterium]|jgi:hypothetical protein
MSVLLEKINSDLKKSMQEKDELAISVLRLLISSIRNKEISLRSGSQIDLKDEQVAEVIKAEIKKRTDSIDIYRQGGREDLAGKEEKEKIILEKYLPPQMSDEELEKIVAEIVASAGEVSEKDFGRIMGQVIAKTKGQADGSKVSVIVKKILAK